MNFPSKGTFLKVSGKKWPRFFMLKTQEIIKSLFYRVIASKTIS